jgi:hypothetical protein
VLIMSKPTKKLIIPFSCPCKDRIQPFTEDMEMAAIYYFAQKERKKGEGRVLKKPEEKLAFIAKTGYPIWLVPWKGRTLIFDGLEFTNKTISINKIPDIKDFETDIQASSKSHEAYSAALSQNSSYFQNLIGTEETIIEGLITNTDFVQDFSEYVKDAVDLNKVDTAKVILTPLLDESEVASSVEKLSEVRKRVENDINNLSSSMRFLSKSSRDQIKSLQNELKKSVKEFDKKIKTLRPKVMAKIKIIKIKRDNEVTKISKNYSKKLRLLHQRKVLIERTLERFSAEIDRIDSDIKVYREKKDEAREFQLNQKIDEIKKKLPSLNKELKDIEKEIINVEDAKKIEVSRARSKPDTEIEKAMKSLDDIAAEKEAKARLELQEITSLEDMTSVIIKQIDAIIKEKEIELNEIDSIGIQERRRNQALIYIPIYFVSYETELSKRYVVYPPSTVSSMGIKTKLKSVFGSGKMNSLISSRSQAIAALVDNIIDLTQENPVFQKEITEAGLKACIFHNSDYKDAIKRGITKLKEEGWISENEFGFRYETESS